MLSLEVLENFNPKFSAVSCYVEHGDKILVMKRHPDKPQGETWCLPSGKIGQDESETQAILRELLEETGIQASEEDLQYGQKMYVRYPDYDFIFHTFSLPVKERPEINLNPTEHTELLWETKENVLQLPLIEDFIPQLKLHYKQNEN